MIIWNYATSSDAPPPHTHAQKNKTTAQVLLTLLCLIRIKPWLCFMNNWHIHSKKIFYYCWPRNLQSSYSSCNKSIRNEIFFEKKNREFKWKKDQRKIQTYDIVRLYWQKKNMKVFFTMFSPFVCLRCCFFVSLLIREDVCFLVERNLNVIIFVSNVQNSRIYKGRDRENYKKNGEFLPLIPTRRKRPNIQSRASQEMDLIWRRID